MTAVTTSLAPAQIAALSTAAVAGWGTANIVGKLLPPNPVTPANKIRVPSDSVICSAHHLRPVGRLALQRAARLTTPAVSRTPQEGRHKADEPILATKIESYITSQSTAIIIIKQRYFHIR